MFAFSDEGAAERLPADSPSLMSNSPHTQTDRGKRDGKKCFISYSRVNTLTEARHELATHVPLEEHEWMGN